MIVIVHLQTSFHIQYVGMFMISLRTKFQMPSSTDSLVTTIKPKAKWMFRTVAILLFYASEKVTWTEFEHYIRKSISILHFSTLNFVTLMLFAPHKFECPPCCCYLLLEIKNHDVEVFYNDVTFKRNSMKIGQTFRKLKWGYTYKAWWFRKPNLFLKVKEYAKKVMSLVK
jgi:hypothetical protein